MRWPIEVWRVMLGGLVWGIGGGLNYVFLNFHLQALGLSKAEIGLANATPAIAAVLFSIPLAFLIPRLGYVKSLLLGTLIAVVGNLGVASGLAVYAGLLVSGLGQGLVLGSVSPLLASYVNPKKQVSVFTWMQSLMAGAGFIGSLLGGFLPDLLGRENVLYFSGLAFLLSGLFLIGLPNRGSENKRFALRNRRNWLLLMVPQIIIGVGAGLTLPFLNLYLQAKFDLSFASVGWLFAVTSLTSILALTVQPMLARRLGKVGAIMAVQAASLPFLMILAWVPWLPLVTLAMFVRGALMNAAGPVYTALVMEHLDEEERSGFLLIEGAMWQLGWASATALSGQVQQQMGLEGFNYLFGAMLLMYVAAIAYYPLFFKPKVRRGAAATD